MKRALILVFAVALLGLVAWLAWDGGGAADVARPEGASAEPSATGLEPLHSTERQPAVVPDPPQAPPQPREPARDQPAEIDLATLARTGPEIPPGTIEAHVLRGTQPLQIEVELSRYRSSIVIAAQLDDPRDALERRKSDERGIALFSGLEPGDYSLRAQLADGSAVEAHASLSADQPHGERAWLLFGEGGIRGRVFGPDGAPRPDARVAVSAWHLPSRTEVVTSWEGAYSVGGLRSGDYSVEELTEGDESAVDAASLHVHLAPGEWKTVDLGAAGGLVHWSGTLRLSDGQPASGPQQLELREVERGEASVVQIGADSRIATELPPGRYAVRIWCLGNPLELGEVALEVGQGEVDVLVPGAELTGIARWAEGVLLPGEDRTARYTQVWLKSLSKPERSGFASTDDTGRFIHRALEPGDWAVSVYPGSLSGAPLDGLIVRVVEGTTRVVLDLELAAP